MIVIDLEPPTMKPEDSIVSPIALQRTSRPNRSRPLHPTQQRGSLLIQFAVFLSIMVLILGVVDLGYSFYAKRDLQRIADLAAIEAVQGIQSNDSAACTAAGILSVETNWPAPINPTNKSVECGEWDSIKHESKAPRYFSNDSKLPQNAAHVVLEGESPHFVPGPWSRSIRAEAIAQRSEPTAAFQIGSQLLKLNKDAPLGKVLTLIGLDADKLTVLDADGLVDAKISPSGLLKALGVNLGIEGLSVLTPGELAYLNNLSLLQILEASLKVGSDNLLEADLRAVIHVLKDLKIGSVRLLDMTIPLLGDASKGTPGIFTFLSLGKDSSPNGAALDAQVGVGPILNTAIMIAANGHALQIKDTNLLNIVTLGLTVVEPPTIAVGPVGTTANSSQIRLHLDIDSDGNRFLKAVLGLVGLRINLPIKVDGVSADATLASEPQCRRGDHPSSIDVDVVSRVAKITIGHSNLSSSHPDNTLIKTPLSLGVRGPISVDVLKTRGETLEGITKEESRETQPNDLLLGDTLEALTDAVFTLLGGLFSPPILDSNWEGMGLGGNAEQAKNNQIEMLAKLYLEETKVAGLYNVKAATDLMLNGKGRENSEEHMEKLVKENFLFDNAIPATCLLFTCPSQAWDSGTFSEAFHAYTSIPYGVLDAVGIPTLGNGYTSCAGLLSALLAWNACVSSNLNNLLKKHSAQVNSTDANALINSLKNEKADGVTCSGALCVLLKPILFPIKWLLNGIGRAILSPLLTKVLGIELGVNEIKALDINCNSAELVY